MLAWWRRSPPAYDTCQRGLAKGGNGAFSPFLGNIVSITIKGSELCRSVARALAQVSQTSDVHQRLTKDDVECNFRVVFSTSSRIIVHLPCSFSIANTSVSKEKLSPRNLIRLMTVPLHRLKDFAAAVPFVS